MFTPVSAILDWIATNVVIHQGALTGEPFKVLPWQRRFLAGALDPHNVTDSALSLGRGQGKSSLIAAVAACGLDGPLRVDHSEIIVSASSFEQGRIIGRTLLAYLGDKLDDKRTWRVQDSANRFTVQRYRLCVQCFRYKRTVEPAGAVALRFGTDRSDS